MDTIVTKEYIWGWDVTIPCLKCGKLSCSGTWEGWAEKPGKSLHPVHERFRVHGESIRESNNVKEAIDQCYPIAEVFKDYCTNLPS